MRIQTKTGSTFGATLFIIGTCVGIGIIGIPLASGVSGFIPALLMNLLIGLSMMATALLYAEVILALPDGTNLLSATEQTIGPLIRFIVGFCLIFLYISFFTSYFYEAGTMISEFFKENFEINIPIYLAIALTALFFGFFVFMGFWFSSRLIFILIGGLILSYLFLIISGSGKLKEDFLLRQNLVLIAFSAPLIFVTYAFGIVIPSLVTYVQRNAKKILIAIVIGVSLPLLLACIWQGLIIGVLPEETLWEAYESGDPLSESFLLIKKIPWLKKAATFFAFFSIVSSLLGSSLGIVDFFFDGFSIPLAKRVGKKRAAILLLVYIPACLFAIINPEIFLNILQYGAGLGEAIINGILPIWLAWIIRYRQKISSTRLLFGGKPLLLTLFFFIIFIIYLQGLEGVRQ